MYGQFRVVCMNVASSINEQISLLQFALNALIVCQIGQCPSQTVVYLPQTQILLRSLSKSTTYLDRPLRRVLTCLSFLFCTIKLPLTSSSSPSPSRAPTSTSQSHLYAPSPSASRQVQSSCIPLHCSQIPRTPTRGNNLPSRHQRKI